MRVLDLGCGSGETPVKLGLPDDWEIIGCDINKRTLALASATYPQRCFCVARGEELPFAENTFDRVVANVSLPYMHIRNALREIHRVLRPGATVWISYHPLSFTFSEMKRGFLKRMPVIIGGIGFHLAGRSFGESFQTRHGWRLALRDFREVQFSRDPKRWIVTAEKPGGTVAKVVA